MDTVGLRLGPMVALVLATVSNKWFGWFQPRPRKRVALRRIAERLSHDDSQGYD